MNIKENSNTTKTTTSEDEIDISRLFTSIGRSLKKAFKAIFRLFFRFIDKFFNNYRIVLATIFLGGLLGIAYFFYVKPYYESRMSLGSAYYKGQFLDISIQNLNRLCKEGNYNVLAKLLNIPSSKAKTLRRVEVEPIISPNVQLLINLYQENGGNQRKLDSLILNHNDSTFQISVQVYDTTTLIGLDTVLVNYIKKNNFVNKRIQSTRKNLINRKAKLIKESKNLDTLKSYIARSYLSKGADKEGTNVTLNDRETNPIDIYREDFSLYEQQLKIDRLLFINSEIEIIDRFIPFGQPAHGTLLKNALKGALGGLVLAFLYVFFLILRDGLRKFRSSIEQD